MVACHTRDPGLIPARISFLLKYFIGDEVNWTERVQCVAYGCMVFVIFRECADAGVMLAALLCLCSLLGILLSSY